MKNEKLVRSIAKKVRKQCESFAFSKASEGYDFSYRGDLECMCAVASYALMTALQKKKIPCKMISGTCYYDNHCWVEVYNHIVDITATQFGINKRVYISKDKSNYAAESDVKSCHSLGWGKSQNPTRKLTKRILAIKVDKNDVRGKVIV